MSGFKEDLLSILKHNNLLHHEAIGIIIGDLENQKHYNFYKELKKSNSLIDLSDKHLKFTKYDYIILTKEFLNVRNLLKSLVELNRGGIVVLEITGKNEKYEDKYINMVGGTMSGTRVVYEDRAYIVMHTGEDYGN